MASFVASDRPTIGLDHLIALNDEIAALVRSGVPLEQGLRDLGGDMPGRLGKLSRHVAGRMEQGASLSDVLEENPQSFPPIYRAVVKAGIRTGKLASALESVAGTARHLADARRMVAAAMVYPLLVMLIAWMMLVFFSMRIAPSLQRAFEDIDWPGRHLLQLTIIWRDAIGLWWLAVPPALVTMAAAWWFLAGRAGLIQSGWADVLFGAMPWLGSMVRSLRTATFAEVMGLLMEHEVPLDEAIVLAADSAGTARTRRAAEEVASAIRRGEPPGWSAAGAAGFPPLVQWLLQSGYQRGVLPTALRQMADTYRRRAVHQAAVARALLPTLLTVVLGGSVTLLYGILLFWPYMSLLETLTRL